MPTTQGYADMIGTLTKREMDAPMTRSKRIEEAFIAHLLDNGHEVRIPLGRLIAATSKRHGYRLTASVDEDRGELVFAVTDASGKVVTTSQQAG